MDGLPIMLSVARQRAVTNNEWKTKAFLQPALVYCYMIEPYTTWLFRVPFLHGVERVTATQILKSSRNMLQT